MFTIRCPHHPAGQKCLVCDPARASAAPPSPGAPAKQSLAWLTIKVIGGVFAGLTALAFFWPVLLLGLVVAGVIKYAAREFALAARR